MSTLTATSLPTETLPVIDVSGLGSPRHQDRLAVGRQLRAACLDKGFFYASRHGVPATLTRDIFREAQRFFALPLPDKMAIAKAKTSMARGYQPLRQQTLQPGAPPDVKEAFFVGAVRWREDAADPDRDAQWPAALPAFRETVEAYFRAVFDLQLLLWRGLALSLELDEAHFAGFCREPDLIMRVFHYPPQPALALPEEKGAGAHTDFGGLTVLLQDDSGGLQVWSEPHGWIHAPPLPGTFVVNLGDLVARWTNDRYRSTMHRVVNLSGRERYSVAFHFNGNPDHVVSCLPNCRGPGEPERYPPIRAADHVAELIRKAYG
ncbi:MAG TPA: 2OG-Fe(II) oxygenase family protein [Alphaproteobacteria bacterium]|nr:2OG-Fe(II) oxygenase family protein [Alphaproteobacteria bacterium]